MLIPRNVQCRVIAALLSGQLPEGFSLAQLELLLYAFDEPWRAYLGPLLDAMELPGGVDRASFIASYARLSPEHRQIVYEEAGRSPCIPALDQLVLPEVEWVWERWIPRGTLTLFGAMPSAGKSYVALDLARRVIAGTTFPDAAPVRQPGPVIYVDAENMPQLHNRRATAWGIDRSQLYLMGPAENRLMIDFCGDYDRDRLVEWAWALRPALIVVDSLASISTRGENNVEDVRDIFVYLNRVALDYSCGLLVIHHLRKPPAQLPLPRFLTFHDLRGSSHITAMSRSIVGLHWVQTGPQSHPNDPRRMEVLKTNLCSYPPGIGVNFQPLPHDPEVAQVSYGQVPEAYQEPTHQDECAEWLLACLQEHGELPPGQAVRLGGQAGFSRATVYRARHLLGEQVREIGGRRSVDRRWALAPAARQWEGEERPAPACQV